MGLEALGTITGIRPRALNLAFVSKRRTGESRTNKTKTLAIRPKITALGPGRPTQSPPARPKGKAKDCGPYQKVIGKTTLHSPSLAVFQNKLHLVTSDTEPSKSGPRKYTLGGLFKGAVPLEHWIYSNGCWEGGKGLKGGKEIKKQFSRSHVALATFRGRLHRVHQAESSNDLWHSTYDGRRRTTNVKIPGQKSKVAPSLLALRNQLHMVHFGDKSDAIWHSINKGNGWTVNVRIPFAASNRPPALGRVPNGPYSGRLHMVFKQVDSKGGSGRILFHAQHDGRRWKKPVKISGPLSKAAPALVSGYPDQLHMIHLGARSNNLWHMLFGPNKSKGKRIEWFDEQRLLSETSKHPVSVSLFQGCYHMVSQKGGKLMHTTFSTRQVHPGQ